MSADRALLDEALERDEEEGGNVEFKEHLTHAVRLSDDRMESLAAQFRHRMFSGDGVTTYVVGVIDDGDIADIPLDDFSETMNVLSLLAEEAGAHIEDVETWGAGDSIERSLVGVATIRESAMLDVDDDHIAVGTAGHVDHGKSTLAGSLVTGQADNGNGSTRLSLDVQPHGVERGLSADLLYAVYGFSDDGPVHMRNPHRKSDQAQIVQETDRLISFVDTVGHEPWLRATIRGLVGQRLGYGLLVAATDDGPTQTTREHLGIPLAMELPTVVAITKVDAVSEEHAAEVERKVERLLRDVGRTPLSVKRHGIEVVVEKIGESVVSLFPTSAVTMDDLDDLDQLFESLPKRSATEGDFKMYIDRAYSVTSVGAVASGTVSSGAVEAGDELLLGPMSDGEFREVEVRSTEMHYRRVDRANAGRIVGIALKGVREPEIEHGMVLLPADAEPTSVREFEADATVLDHSTWIQEGYEPVVHLETISETAVFHPDGGRLLPGDISTARVEFESRSYSIEEDQRFVFHEERSKGVGTVTKAD